MSLKAIIAPSVLASDFGTLTKECQRVIDHGADWLHMDVMDGHFVPNITIGPPVLACVHKSVENVYMDCHMMVAEPLKWVKDVAEAGGASYTFHIEACKTTNSPSVIEVISAIHESGMKAGVAISPDTLSTDINDEVGQMADMLLVMTVHPGRGGQTFIESCLTKVTELRRRFPNKNIQVDGGAGPNTIHSCAHAGANVIVAGTAVFGAQDSRSVIQLLKDAVQQAIAQRAQV